MAAKDDFLIDLLVGMGQVTQEQLDSAQELANLNGEGVVDTLVQQGVLQPIDVTRAMATYYGTELVELTGMRLSDDIISLVPRHLAKKYNVGIGYCGLQVSEETRERLQREGIVFEPYNENVGFGLKKFISKERDTALRNIAHEQGVDVFKKTSCLIATANKEPDYNAHYYRPNEVGCPDCPNKKI